MICLLISLKNRDTRIEIFIREQSLHITRKRKRVENRRLSFVVIQIYTPVSEIEQDEGDREYNPEKGSLSR